MAETHNRSVPDRFENGLHATIFSDVGMSPEGVRCACSDTLRKVSAAATWSGSGEGEQLWFLGTLATIKVPGEVSDGRFALIEFLFPRPSAERLEAIFRAHGQVNVGPSLPPDG
jgi:hypothetical protein